MLKLLVAGYAISLMLWLASAPIRKLFNSAHTERAKTVTVSICEACAGSGTIAKGDYIRACYLCSPDREVEQPPQITTPRLPPISEDIRHVLEAQVIMVPTRAYLNAAPDKANIVKRLFKDRTPKPVVSAPIPSKAAPVTREEHRSAPNLKRVELRSAYCPSCTAALAKAHSIYILGGPANSEQRAELKFLDEQVMRCPADGYRYTNKV